MLGSAVATGRLPLDYAYELKDRDGLRLRDELEKIGFLGEHDEQVKPRMPTWSAMWSKGRFSSKTGSILAWSAESSRFPGRPLRLWASPVTPEPPRWICALTRRGCLADQPASARNDRHRQLRRNACYHEPSRPCPAWLTSCPDGVEATVDLRNPSNEVTAKVEDRLAGLLRGSAETREGRDSLASDGADSGRSL